jgi:chromate transport protein ChrA
LPFGWRGRLYLVVLSAVVGAVSLDLVWFVAALVMTTSTSWYSGIVFRVVGLSVPVPALLWILYSTLTGMALHYAINRWRHSERDAITSAFD